MNDSPPGTQSWDLIVVGAGIAGLSAAYFAAAAGLGSDRILVLEAADRVGGKLRAETVAGVAVDVGAEAMLNRAPAGVDLARALGLPIVHPAVLASRIWARGELRPLPRTLLGIPLDLADLERSGILSEAGLARAGREPEVPATLVEGDASVGDLVAERFGAEVVDSLVEPLLGGVYSGRAYELSAAAAVPTLIPMLAQGSVLAQAPAVPPSYDAPVFAGIDGGMARLPAALAGSGAFEVHTGAPVTELARSAGGFTLIAGGRPLSAASVIVATPATPAAHLLAAVAPGAAAELARVETASPSVITFAFVADDLPDLTGSGFLVPPAAGRAVKASTFSFAKWAWVREAGRGAGPGGADLAFLRTSVGRHREPATAALSDEELIAVSLAELAELTGLTARPVAAHVQRWVDGLPQYAVGHVEAIARVRADVGRVPGLAVCGASYDGVGIPAVIGSAQRAVAEARAAQ